MYTAFLSALVFTGDPDAPRAEAVLVKGNTIVALGSDEEIERQSPPDTQKIHLPGSFITPGLVDAHTHLWGMGYTLNMVDLRGMTSLETCLSAIAEAAQKAAPGEWVLGRNWNQNIWTEKRDPTRHDLDAACPDNPAVMIRICGHAVWANTRAFDAAGVTPDTPEPFGGKIDREPGTRMPAGVVREAREVVEDAIPVPGTAMRKRGFLACQEAFLSQGITCVHSFESPTDYKVIRELEKEGKLKMRVYHTVHEDEQDEFDEWQKENPPQTDMLWHGHIKMFADGSLGAKSAYLHAPYEGSDDNCGICCMTPEQMLKNVKHAYATGRGVIFHAIGDRALTQCLDAIEAARKEFPGEHRDRIEHVQLARPEDLERMKVMDIAASVQPMSILTDWHVAEEIWGKERCRYGYAWKTMSDLGLRLIFSSDAPIEPISPMEGLQAAVTRKGFDGAPGTPWYPEQCLDLETALLAYFTHGGWATGKDALFGSLAPGKRADLTVLEKDPFTVPKDEIRKIGVKMTVVDGRIVYRNP
ncbi:MAG: amidohydrolase [Desulfobacterales bacterium]|nr:amidohydrolase [Desulfobacterales bacterium]